MVGTICPAGDGTRTGIRKAKEALCLLVGCLVGATALAGAVLGAALASGIGATRTVAVALVVAVVASLVLLEDLKLFHLPIPRTRRQVPPIWLVLYRREFVFLAWGGQLGAGFFTRVGWPGFYVMLGAAFVLGPWVGLAMLATFGLVRGSQPLVALISIRIHDRIQSLEHLHVLECGTLLALAFAMIAR